MNDHSQNENKFTKTQSEGKIPEINEAIRNEQADLKLENVIKNSLLISVSSAFK